MSDSREGGLEAPVLEGADGQTLVSMSRSPELRLGPLFLLVFMINVAVVILYWLLVGLLI
jgi:hypothetical protein